MEEFEYDVCCVDEDDRMSVLAAELAQQSGSLAAPPGISRQQLINRYSTAYEILTYIPLKVNRTCNYGWKHPSIACCLVELGKGQIVSTENKILIVNSNMLSRPLFKLYIL